MKTKREFSAGTKLHPRVAHHEQQKIQNYRGIENSCSWNKGKKSGYIRSLGAGKGSGPTASSLSPLYSVNNVIWSILLTWNISLHVSLISLINFGFILTSL